MEKGTPKRIHFNSEDDLYLLREVVALNSYEEPKRWNLIQIHILQVNAKQASIRSLRERTNILVNKYKRLQKKEQFMCKNLSVL